jgi:adenosyl cobinamide kinase/adenosyl cobinamide phosphate guanylyltransferase
MSKQQKSKEQELYDPFDDGVRQYQEEVKQRWSDTEAYKQSMKRVQKMTKEEMEIMKESAELLIQNLARSMDKGIRDKEVQALIAEHYKGIQFFYDCPLKMYRGLGKMYVDDPRFAAYYNRHRSGLAIFMRDAIAYFCDIRESQT